MVNKDVYQQPR